VARWAVVTALRDPQPARLARCVESVGGQIGVSVDHLLVDCDAGEDLDRELSRSAGQWVAFVDQHDALAPGALAAMEAALDAGADVAYSDHAVLGPDGAALVALKPDFSPERLRSHDYVSHLLAASREVLAHAGGVGAGGHDLALRLTERATGVAHLAEVLYLRRATAPDPDAGRAAVQAHCSRLGIVAGVHRVSPEGCYRVVRELTAEPLVSVVIPTRGTSGRVWGLTRAFVVDAVRGLVERSTYPNVEFVVVHDDVTPAPVIEALRAAAGDRLVLVPYAAPFNFSAKVNLGVAMSSGELVLLLNDDTELIEPDSVGVMVGHLQDPGVAMVGAKLLYGDGTLQHGGHVYHRAVGHACLGWSGDSPGPAPLWPLAVARECSGVTAAAALVRRDVFDRLGGFTVDLPLNYNDVDFSLKVRATGGRIIWTPWASWYHFESRTRHSALRDEEVTFVRARWGRELGADPYYHPNMTTDRADWLEDPGVVAALRQWA
jgi:O-antigen biosynthesis protein